MKHVLFNGITLKEKDFQINPSNRAFRYGDGLFETIGFRQGKVSLLPLHVSRLHRASQVLGLELPGLLQSEPQLNTAIKALVEHNALGDTARIRLQVWRSPGGLYTPKNNTAQYLLEAMPFHQSDRVKEKVGIARSVHLHPSAYSALKTCNALPYILAAQERQRRGLDDLILLDHEGHISECCAANLFWRKGEKFYTPALRAGCINGVMRQYLIKKMVDQGYFIGEVMVPSDILLGAEQVFSTNAMGIQAISSIGNTHFQKDLGLIQQWVL